MASDSVKNHIKEKKSQMPDPEKPKQPQPFLLFQNCICDQSLRICLAMVCR
jgi:hypothetical protein